MIKRTYADIRRAASKQPKQSYYQRHYVPPPPPNFAMEDVKTMGTPYSGGRKYAGLERYNTNVDRIYTKGFVIQTTTANTQNTGTIQMPTVVNPDGTVCACEVIAAKIGWNSWPTADGTYAQELQIFVDGPGSDQSLAYDDTIMYAKKGLSILNSANGALHYYDQHEDKDLTDKAGVGRVIVQDLTWRYTTAGYAGTSAGTCQIWYKMKTLTTAAFVAERQKQRSAR